MTYVVDEKCIKCKTTDCVAVCPVNCFYEGENMLVIHPDECIDCGVCVPECPVDAIKADTSLASRSGSSSTANTRRSGQHHGQEGHAQGRSGLRDGPENSTSTFLSSRVKALSRSTLEDTHWLLMAQRTSRKPLNCRGLAIHQ